MIIYKATCLYNNKVYIGQTCKPLTERIASHKYSAFAKSDTLFHKAIRKYGFNSFRWDVLGECKTEEELNRSEICEVCRGNRKTAGGYIWKYKD